MKLRVYDNKGRERWASVNELIPAGWYDSECQVLTEPRIVKIMNINDISGDMDYKNRNVLFLDKL